MGHPQRHQSKLNLIVPEVSVALVWGPRLRIWPITFFRKS